MTEKIKPAIDISALVDALEKERPVLVVAGGRSFEAELVTIHHATSSRVRLELLLIHDVLLPRPDAA